MESRNDFVWVPAAGVHVVRPLSHACWVLAKVPTVPVIAPDR